MLEREGRDPELQALLREALVFHRRPYRRASRFLRAELLPPLRRAWHRLRSA
jgi:hypothetical protein